MKIFMALLVAMTSAGCATYRTISEAPVGRSMVFSGARLDAAAVSRDEYELRKFRSAPPAYPLLDFPFSLAADAFLLPLTLPATLSALGLEPLK